LGNLSHRGAKKYLLVTSIEDGKQNKAEWEAWFKGVQEVAFDPNLFGFFASQDFKEVRKVIEGYYAVCLLRVKAL
jgi:flavodoxin